MNGGVWLLGRQTAIGDCHCHSENLRELVFAKYIQTVFSLSLYGCIGLRTVPRPVSRIDQVDSSRLGPSKSGQVSL